MPESKLAIDQIWWRNVQLGEFYNIERHHKIAGGGGSTYIEIPSSMVPDTLDFLGVPNANVDNFNWSIEAKVVGDPGLSAKIEFRSKKGRRMRIARQNRQQPGSQRHPAWTAQRGFPKAPDNVRNRADASAYFPKGGLRIYLARTFEMEFYAGFTKGARPKDMKRSDPMWELYPEHTRPVGGIIKGSGN